MVPNQAKQPTNCLSVFDLFVGLARKGLIKNAELLIFVGDKSSSTNFSLVLHFI